MFSFNDKISLRQFQILLMLYIFGTGVIILPRKAAIYAGRDGWAAFIITTCLALIAVFIITSLVKRFPHKSFYEYTSVLITRPIAFVLTLGLIFKTIIGLACELRFFAEIVKYVLLYNTPYTLIAISLLMLSAYAAGKGIETKARIGQIIVWIIFIPLTFVFIVVGADVDFSELAPLMQTEPRQLAIGAYHLLFAFSGMEFILLISPYLNNHKRLSGRALSCILVLGLFMCFSIILTTARFGPNNLGRQMWPILELMDATPLPGSFIERQEAIMMSFWILSVFAMISGGLFFASVAAKSVFKVGKHKHYLLIVAALAFILSLWLSDINFVYHIMDMNFLYLGTAYMLVIPAFLLMIAILGGINFSKYKAAGVLSAAIATLLLSGCWDSSELSNRGFVTAISIDADEESEHSYKVSVEMPITSRSGADELEKNIISNNHRTLNSAIYNSDTSSEKEIFLGHMKVLVCGKELLGNREMFRHTIGTLIRDRSISRTLLVLASEEAGSDIIEAKLENENLIGIYISDFFKKTGSSNIYRQSLDKLAMYFAEGKVALIPRIEVVDEEVKFKGAAVMKDYQLKGWMDDAQLKGFMWLQSGHSNLDVADSDESFSLGINKHKADISFLKGEEKVYAKISINLDADIIEAPIETNTDLQSILKKAEKSIENDIRKAYQALYYQMGVDGFNLTRQLEKKNPGLYKAHIQQENSGVLKMPLVFDINITLRSTGSLV